MPAKQKVVETVEETEVKKEMHWFKRNMRLKAVVTVLTVGLAVALVTRNNGCDCPTLES